MKNKKKKRKRKKRNEIRWEKIHTGVSSFPQLESRVLAAAASNQSQSDNI